jgi:hypothetical protein
MRPIYANTMNEVAPSIQPPIPVTLSSGYPTVYAGSSQTVPTMNNYLLQASDIYTFIHSV